MAHLEIVGSIVHQLTKNASIEELEKAGYIAAKGDPIANLQEDLAAEQKARATYEKLIDLCRDNPDVLDPLKFLRQREIVHFQRFGEALRGIQDRLATKKMYINECKNNNQKTL